MPAAAFPLPLTAARVTMSADEFVAVNYRLWRHAPATRRRTRVLRLALGLLSVSLLLGAYGRWQTGAPLSPLTLAFPGVAGLYALWRPWQVKRLLRRGYAANPVLQQPATYRFDGQGFAGESPAGPFAARWADIRRVVRVGDWFLLYPSATGCNYVDGRRLAPPATPEDLERLLRQHAGRVHHLA